MGSQLRFKKKEHLQSNIKQYEHNICFNLSQIAEVKPMIDYYKHAYPIEEDVDKYGSKMVSLDLCCYLSIIYLLHVFVCVCMFV